jgi:hypothetical protein
VYGDQWNGEDLSIFSVDDQTLPVTALPRTPEGRSSSASLKVPSSQTVRREVDDELAVTPSNLKRTLTNPSISSEARSSQPELTNTPGYRAADAYVRPAPIVVNGAILDYGFDLKGCEFTLDIEGKPASSDSLATTIFLPEWHFPQDQCTVIVSSGKWEISTDDDERTWIQKLRWWHGAGKQSVKVKGLVRPRMALAGTAEEAGYLEQCQQSYGVNLKDCTVM